MQPDTILHTGPVRPTQAQSDEVWSVLEGNARVVALLRFSVTAAARERGWETVKNQTGIRPEAVRCSSGLVIDSSESSVTLPRGDSIAAGRRS